MIIKIADYIKNNINNTKYSTKNFKQQPLKSLGQLFPITMICSSILGFVVALFIFIVQGGFSQQISTMKGDWLGQVENAFTLGTVKILVSGVVASILLILLLFEFIMIMINYIKNETRFKSISCIGAFIVGICFSIPSAFILGVGFDIINYTGSINNKLEWIFVHFENPKESAFVIAFEIIGIVGLLALILFCILMILSKQRGMIKECFIALTISFVILPLTLLLIENIIPLIVGIVGLAILGIFIVVIFKVIISSLGENNNTSSAKITNNKSNRSKSSEKDTKKDEKKAVVPATQKNCAYISNYKEILGSKLYKRHGFLHDYIEYDNGVGQSEVCSLEMLRKGEFHIYDAKTKQEIKEHEIPWKVN